MSEHIKKALKVAAVVFVGYALATLGGFKAAFTAAKTVFATTLIGSLTSKGIEAVNANFGKKFTTRAPTAPRQIVYGQTRIGGILAHIETSGTDNVILHQVIVLAGHEIDSLVKVKFNDTDLTLDSGSSVSGSTVFKATNTKYKNTENENKIDANGTLVQLTFEDGSQTTANGFLTNQLASMTADHKFKDCAYVYIQMVFDAEKFAGGIPAISFEVKGKKVYDPRSGETAFTDSTGEQIGSNPALCIRDYISNTTYGLKATSSELNDTTNAGGFNSAATTCEQQINDIDGSAQNRYTANGFTNFSASGEGILEGLLTSMAGRLTYINGKFNVFAGATQTPSLTITDDDLLSDISVATNPNSGDLYNTVKPVYTDASSNYTAADAPVFQSSTFLSADTPSGESSANYVKQLEIRMPFTTNSSTAQRIARIKLNEQRQTQALDVLVSLKFMQLQPNDWVYLTNTRLSYASKVFEVVSTQLEVIYNDDVPVVATRLILRETANSVYNFVANDYETEIAEGSQVSTGTFAVSSPTALSATSVVSVDITTTKINIQTSWTNATNNAIQGTEIRYGTSSGTYTGSVLVGRGETTAVIPNLNSNTTYYLVARHFSNNNIFSPYTAEVSRATGASTSAPSIPTSLAATTGNPLAVKVSWTNPSNSDLRAVKIFRHTSAITPTNDTYLVNTVAVEPGTTTSVLFGKQDGLSADTTYYFYARAINHTGLQSSFTSGVTGNFTEVEVTDIDLPDFSGYFHKEGTTTTALTNSQFNTEYGRVPLNDDILIMVNTSASPKVSKAYKYSGSSFSEISNFTTGDLVVDGTLAGSKIVAASIAADRVDTSFISTLNLITTSATIGNDITIGSGSSIFKADSNGIYLGNATFASAPFRVTPAGVMTASAAILSGTIKAGESISAGTGTRSVNLSGSTNTDIILSAGNATPSLAPFKVKSDGSIEITNLKLFKSDGVTKMFDSATGFTNDAFSEIATDLGTAISTYAVSKTGSTASDAQKITLTSAQSITVEASKPAYMTGNSNQSGSGGATDATNQIPAKVTMVLKHSTNANLSGATTLAFLGSSATGGVTKLVSPTGTASATQYRVSFFTESEVGFTFTEAFTITNEGANNSINRFSISDTATYAAGDHYFFVEIGGTAGTSTQGANNVNNTQASRGMTFSGTSFHVATDGAASDTGEGDITSVTAGTGLSGGGTAGAVTLSLTTPATPLDNIRSLGSQAFTGTATTAGMMSEIESDGGFDSYTSVFKTTWNYAGNFDLSDAGRFTETAGTSFITWTDNSSDTTRGNITVLAIAPNTGGSAGKQFIYNDQGSSYSPGWREIWGNTSDGSGSGLDADTLDGFHASSFITDASAYITNSGVTANFSNKVVSTNRGAGIYGIYDSYKTDHIWSMGAAYNNDGNGADFGSLYGLAYKHTNNTTGGTMGGGHQMVWVINGVPQGAIGDNQIWHHEAFKVTSSNHIVWHAGNDGAGSGLDADTVDGIAGASIITADSGQTNSLYIRNASPTIWLRDTDHISSMIHQNSNYFYILRADAADDVTWTTYSSTTAGAWPMSINLTNTAPEVRFGPSLIKANLNVMWHAGNDGSGSGLDADLLDGQNGATIRQVLDSRGSYAIGQSTTPATIGSGHMRLDFWNTVSGLGSQYRSVLSLSAYTSGSQWTQLAFNYNSSTSEPIYFRQNNYNGASFGAWQQIWDSANDGAGSGLDADTVDGIQGASILRNDTNNTFNTGAGMIDFSSTQAGWMTRFVNTAGTNAYVYMVHGTHGMHIRNDSSTTGQYLLDVYPVNGNAGRFKIRGGDGLATSGGNIMWHAGNDGAGSGLDADTVDGIAGASLLRSDADDIFTGKLISSIRNKGVFGTYNSYLTDHIWSMGTAYENSSTGSNFGNLYGLAYKHTNNGTGGTMAGGHQMVWCQNGTPNSAVGTNIWTSGNVTAYSDIRVKTNIERIPNALEKVSMLNGYTFDRTDVTYDEFNEPTIPIRQTGVIAQEVLEVLPEAVTGDSDHYSVAYGNLAGLLIEAIKEQQETIQELTQRINNIENKGE